MKKFKILSILFIGLFIFSACSDGFCTESDKEALKEKIRIENIEQIKQDAVSRGLEGEDKQSFIDEQIQEIFEGERKACMTLDGEVIYEDPEEGILLELESKSWSAAFDEGFFQGLLIYPVSVMLIFFTDLFGAGGYGQILAIVVVTVILRLFTLLITLKSSYQTHKMQSIQPEIAEIQNKMKETQDSMEKQKYGMEMMSLYKKHGINPLSSLIMPFISLPIFIAIWRAVLSTYTLREGEIYGLSLGVDMSEQIFSFSIVAILLFILMGASQFVSMKTPVWLASKDKKKTNKPDKKNQLSTFTNIMLVVILIASFALPAAMVIYWTVGAMFGIGQAFLLRYINKKRENGSSKMEKVKTIK